MLTETTLIDNVITQLQPLVRPAETNIKFLCVLDITLKSLFIMFSNW